MSNALPFARIESGLKSERSDYFKKLQNGVTDADLDAFSTRFGLELPEGFRALYKWRNGQSPKCYESLIGNRMFLSLEEISETKAELDSSIDPDNDDDVPPWNLQFIPFLSDGGGNYTVVDLSPEGQGCLRNYYHDDDSRPVKNPNIEHWIRQLADTMDED